MNEFSENNLIEQTAVNINSFDFLLPKLVTGEIRV